MKTINKNILVTSVAFALAFATWLPTTASAADGMKPIKAGEHIMNKLDTKEQADALKVDDSIAMVGDSFIAFQPASYERGNTSGAPLPRPFFSCS